MSEKSPTRSDEEVLRIFKNAKNRPKSSVAVGFDVLEVNQAAGTVKIGFVGLDEWTNPIGGIQGGFLTAMLDETMTTAGLIAADFKRTMPTLELKVNFLRPVKPGPVFGIGRVRRIGKSVAFLEGELYDPEDRLVAKASATAMPKPIPGRD